MTDHRANLDLTGFDADGPHESWRVPVHVQHLEDDALTSIDFEFGGEHHHLSVSGTVAPYEVTFTWEFVWQSPPKFATFPVAPDVAPEHAHLENLLRPQLIEIHEHLLQRDERERQRRLTSSVV